MYKHYQEYMILLKDRLPSISQYMTYSHQMEPSLGLEGISMKRAVPLMTADSLPHSLKGSLNLSL